MILLESLTKAELDMLLQASVYLLAVAFGAGILCRFLLSWANPGRY